ERSNSRPVAYGVVFKDAHGLEHRAYLKQGTKSEIIVSAGALGRGMKDNPMNAVFIPSPTPTEVSLIQVVGITNFGSYIEAASGENFNRDSQQNFGMFSPKIGQFSKLPPKQRTPEALAKAIEKMESLQEEAFQGGFILEKINGPISKGHLELRNTDPNENPLVLGVDALRVIDGSTFNYSPGTNPQATVMMLGRYMGVKILQERLVADETK
ncbi:protein HOTHEAD-like, partial [Trifolium pratense]